MSTTLDKSKNPGFGKGFVADPAAWGSSLKTLEEAVTMMVADEEVSVDGRVYKAPSWGAFGLKMPTTPVFVFDRPELIPVFGDTMCTDMAHIYIYLPFMQKLVDEFNEKGTYGLPIVLAHELGHMLMTHGMRLDVLGDKYTHAEKNIAGDIEINIPLVDDFNERYPVGDLFMNTGWGIKDDGPEKWRNKSLEEIIPDIADEIKKKQEEAKKNQQGQPGEPGQQPGQPGQGDGEPSDGQGDPSDGDGGDPSQGKAGGGDPSQGKAGGGDAGQEDIKKIEDIVEQIAKIAEETGDDSLLDALAKAGIIDKQDVNAIKEAVKNGEKLPSKLAGELKKIEDSARSSGRQAIQQAQELREKMGTSMPGAHSIDYMVSRIRADEEAAIEWASVFRKIVRGIGNHKQTDINKANSLSYLRAKDLGMKKRMPYLPGKTMAKSTVRIRAAVDTSGSMSDRDLTEALTELMGMAKQMDAEIYIYSIDTTIRDYPTLLTPDLIEKVKEHGAKFFGRGGTSIARGLIELHNRNEEDDLKNALDISDEGRKKASSSFGKGLGGGFGANSLGKKKGGDTFDLTIYVSDLEDFVPPADVVTPEEHDKILLLATSRVSQRSVREFRDGGWPTYRAEKGAKIDIDNLKAGM